MCCESVVLYCKVQRKPNGYRQLAAERATDSALSIEDFFRQMANVLLVWYFKTKGLLSDLHFAAMKEGKPDELFGLA